MTDPHSSQPSWIERRCSLDRRCHAGEVAGMAEAARSRAHAILGKKNRPGLLGRPPAEPRAGAGAPGRDERRCQRVCRSGTASPRSWQPRRYAMLPNTTYRQWISLCCALPRSAKTSSTSWLARGQRTMDRTNHPRGTRNGPSLPPRVPVCDAQKTISQLWCALCEDVVAMKQRKSNEAIASGTPEALDQTLLSVQRNSSTMRHSAKSTKRRRPVVSARPHP